MKSILAILLAFVLICGCVSEQKVELPSRESKIPADAVKMTPEMDQYPPQLHSNEWSEPVPLEGPINTAGGEDSPFIAVDRNEFYFFFTPDVSVPVEKQLLDNVTGIYVSKKTSTGWSEPERVILQDPGKLAMDGCEFVQGNTMWFCSAREGYTGVHWFTADYKDGKWTNWKNADFKPEYEVGELYFSPDWNQLYFHSARPGGKGGLDIWMSQKSDGEWQEPQNIAAVNSADDEGWMYLTPDQSELWFTRFYYGTPAIFRSKKADGEWQEPELIISQFAGEPTFDDAGNLYFIHHFYHNGTMIEGDIYVAYKK
ncbi:MAG: hypothetical protein PHF60_03475 [Candidatus ainarchaeum sp.]|nr:hypothetical protein [Candidatus ainarchaeum sp.]